MKKSKRCEECGHGWNMHNRTEGCGLLACDCTEKPT